MTNSNTLQTDQQQLASPSSFGSTKEGVEIVDADVNS